MNTRCLYSFTSSSTPFKHVSQSSGHKYECFCILLFQCYCKWNYFVNFTFMLFNDFCKLILYPVILLRLSTLIVTAFQSLPWSSQSIDIYFTFVAKLFFKKNILFIQREGREKGRERNIDTWLPLARPQLGIQPATQACVPTRMGPSGSQAGTQTTEPHQLGLWPNSCLPYPDSRAASDSWDCTTVTADCSSQTSVDKSRPEKRALSQQHWGGGVRGWFQEALKQVKSKCAEMRLFMSCKPSLSLAVAAST